MSRGLGDDVRPSRTLTSRTQRARRRGGRWPVAAATSLVLAGCGRTNTSGPRPVLLFAGTGTSPGDVSAVEQVLQDREVGYATIDSRELDAMSASELASYRLLLIPGGNFEVMGRSLAPQTPAKIRDAVTKGLAYLGICAGAFYAGDSPYQGLNLTGGVRFRFYADDQRGIRKAVLRIESASGEAIDSYWEDGPELSGRGEVVATYPDGSPAVAQGRFGDGFLILVGVHPEAPGRWRRHLSSSQAAAIANRYAGTIVTAAIDRRPLPHFE